MDNFFYHILNIFDKQYYYYQLNYTYNDYNRCFQNNYLNLHYTPRHDH